MGIYRGHQCCHHELYTVGRQDTESNDFSGEQVDDRCQIYSFSMEWDMGEIRCPDVVRIPRKFIQQEVWEYLAAYSTPKLPPIPGESYHRFHGKAATCSTR